MEKVNNISAGLLTLGFLLFAAGCSTCYECIQPSGNTSYCSEEYTQDELIVLEDACENAGGRWNEE